jgi:quinolinate synthase
LIFAPDKNLGAYINERQVETCSLGGACEVHETNSTERIIGLKMAHPDAVLLAHPECKAPVLLLADFVGSTAAMLNIRKQVL